MRVCVFGAGAIGGFVAGYMARAGLDVSVVARGAHLQAIRARGLTVQTEDETFTTPVRATDDPARLGPQDAVIVTVKAPGLPAVAPALAPLLGPDTPVAFLTNGIPWWYCHGLPPGGPHLPALDPGDTLWRTVGPRTVGGIAWPASSVPEPGLVRAPRPKARPTVLGAIDGHTTPAIRSLADAFTAAGLPVAVETRIRDRIWEKLAFNCSAGILAVLTETPIAATQTEPALTAASRTLMTEVQSLARALGCDPVIPMDTILSGNRTLQHRPSILQDWLAGRAMEVDALYTNQLRLAEITGTPMPTLSLLAALIRTKVAGRS